MTAWLEQIDVSDVGCAAGPAQRHVPALLPRLVDASPARRRTTRQQLAGLCGGRRDGLPHPVASRLVAPLLRLISEPAPTLDAPDVAGLLRLVVDVVHGGATELAFSGFDARDSNQAWLLESDRGLPASHVALVDHLRQTRAAWRRAWPVVSAQLASKHEAIRTHAAFALALLPEARDESIPGLTARLADEAVPRPAGAMAWALGLLKAPEIPPVRPTAVPAPLAAAIGRALGPGLDDVVERALVEAATDETPSANPGKRLGQWPFYDGHLGMSAGPAVLHASVRRGDEAAHRRLIDALGPRWAERGHATLLRLRLGIGARQHRRLAPHELDPAQRAAIDDAIQVPLRLDDGLEAAGVLPHDHARQLDPAPDDPLARRHDGEPLWRILSDVADDACPLGEWRDAIVALDPDPIDRLDTILDAAGGPLRLYRAGAHDGIPAGDARWPRLDDVLWHAASDLADVVGARAARYAIAHGLNQGVFLLELARRFEVDPATAWVQHVRAEIEKQWCRDARVDGLKRWADQAD